MESILAGKIILVTGGTGFIGSGIVRQALQQEVSRVIVFSRDEIKHFMMKNRLSDSRLECIVGDVRDLRSIEDVFARFKVDIVYHAAAMKHVVMCEDFPTEVVKTNILGTQNIIDLAIKYAVPKVMTISTDKAAYPVNVMGATKLIAERITLNANRLSKEGQAFSLVRFGNVANSRGSVIPVFIDNLLHRQPLRMTSPEVTRFIMEIQDAVRLIFTATEYAQGGETFILKMKAFRLGNLADIMVKKIAPLLHIAAEAVRIETSGLVTGEKLHEDLINGTESSRLYELDDMYIVLSNSKLVAKYPAIQKASLSRYTSKDAERISAEEIERIVRQYVKEIMEGEQRLFIEFNDAAEKDI